MPDLIAVVLAEPSLVGLDDAAPSPAARLLGLPLVWRSVLAADRAGCRQVVVVGERELVRGLAVAHRISATLSSGTLDDAVRILERTPGAKALVLSPWVLLDRRQIERLAATAAAAGEASPIALTVLRDADPVRPWPDVALRELAVARLEHHLPESNGQALPLLAGDAASIARLLTPPEGDLWSRLVSPCSRGGLLAHIVPDAEASTLLASSDFPRVSRRLLSQLHSSADGLVDRHLNRRISRYVTLAVVNHPVTPNQITAVALVLGLAAVALVMTGSYGLVVAGAVLLQISSMIDCADGEVARLKYLESRLGAYLDIVADNVVHIALFLAVGRAVSLRSGETALELGIAAAIGGLVSFLLVLSAMAPGNAPAVGGGSVKRFLDRMTNRDFTLLLLACAVADRLSWFLWALAIGVQLFWITLLALQARAFFDARRRAAWARVRRSTLLALLLLLLGAGVVALLVASVGFASLRATLAPVGARLPLLLAPYAVVYVLDCLGWYHAFGARKPRISLPRLFSLRMAGESLNNVTPLGYVGGEPAKALLLQRAGIPAADALASVVVAKTVMTLAQVPFVIMGVAAAAAELGRAGALGKGLVALTLLLAVGTVAAVALQRRGLFSGLLALLDLLRLGARVPAGLRASLLETDGRLGAFYRERRRDFALCFGCFFLGWLAGVPEVIVALGAMGQEVGLRRALAIESLVAVVKIAGFLVPASVGAQEAGTTALLAAFGYSPEVALSFALLRRAREIVWIAFGLACLAHHGRSALERTPRAT